MIVSCKQGCKFKKGTANALLDLASDKVLCEFCQEELPVSAITKTSMKQRGEIFKNNNKKAFQFKCSTCTKTVETELSGAKLIGKECTGDCKFNVSKNMIYTMHVLNKINKNIKSDESEDETNE